MKRGMAGLAAGVGFEGEDDEGGGGGGAAMARRADSEGQPSPLGSRRDGALRACAAAWA